MKPFINPFRTWTLLATSGLLWSQTAIGQTAEASLISGIGAWQTVPKFTVGETITGWTPPGIMDGIGARRVGGILEVYVNHELGQSAGASYQLQNGTSLKGGRITRFDIDASTQQITAAALAYDRIYDRAGNLVTSAQQINEGSNAENGIDRPCSAALFEAGRYNLVDDIFFSGEETSNGQEFALDVAGRDLWSAPWLGRAAWENVTLLQPGNSDQVAILIGDDTEAAPLYLYIGEKGHVGDGSFLDRNGLAHGVLHVFVADNGALNPQQFSGTGNRLGGSFQPITHYDAALAGTPGYDALGFADQATQYALGDAIGMFRFSRPEDVATDPYDPTRAVMASTGRGQLYPADNWGTTYIIDVDFSDLSVELSIIYDGDDAGNGQFGHPDLGLRNPDNLEWAKDGFIYLQEDRSTSPSSLFGATSLEEASMWKLNPQSGKLARIAQVDRSAALPAGQFDNNPSDRGNWETSGILDVSELLDVTDRIVMLAVVQGHSIRGGAIADLTLVEGGQFLFLEGPKQWITTADTQAKGVNGWRSEALFTIGEQFNGYYMPGIPDGMGVQAISDGNVRVFVNQELGNNASYTYSLENGTQLRGARISQLDVDPASFAVVDAGLAYDRIYDRAGMLVTSPAQINSNGSSTDGFARFCSGEFFKAGMYNLADDMYLTGEESDNGTLYALDPATRSLHAVPWAGRAAWENVTLLRHPNPNRIAMIIGDDSEAAPLYLFVGRKNHFEDGSFLDRNGLAYGDLYVWSLANGALDPDQWNGTGNQVDGRFFKIAHYNAAMAGMPGYDAMGFATQERQYELADAVGGFRFSRPEDVHTDPTNDRRFVLASTGRGQLFPADNWGTMYILDVNTANLKGTMRVLYDGDDAGAGQFSHPDFGLRSPDNLVWAGDGYIYVQEDKSTSPGSLFGGTSGMEASIWKIDPVSGVMERVAMVDRQCTLPEGQFDNSPSDLGNWETSGITDVSMLFGAPANEVWLLFNVQGHSIRGGTILTENLVQGGQVLLLKGQRGSQSTYSLMEPLEGTGAIAHDGMVLFPVPVSDVLNIAMEPGAPSAELVVVDLQGRRVMTLRPDVAEESTVTTIDVSALKPGVYMLQHITEDLVRSTRFVKQ